MRKSKLQRQPVERPIIEGSPAYRMIVIVIRQMVADLRGATEREQDDGKRTKNEIRSERG